MATSDEFVNLAEKRLLSKDRLNTNFFEYLYEHTLDLWTSIFPAAGFFTYPVNIFIYAGTFDLIPLAPLPASPARGCDNAGHLLELAGATRLTNIPYENDSLSDYWIALHYAEIPSGVYPNPRTGINEFDKTKEEIGLRDYPDVVVDTGLGTVTFTVDSVCPSIAPSDYGGRDVWVWLRNPLSSDIGVALEHLTITWDGSNNKVTSVAAFGQSTISTVLTDYYVCLDGPCVYNAGAGPTVNPYTDDYLLIGYIDDSDHTAIDESLQIDLSGGGGHSLQAAYNGLTGSGSGRDITIDDQAVLLAQTNTAVYEKDIAHSVMRFLKDGNIALPGNPFVAPYAIADVESALDIKMRLRSFASVMDRRNLMDTTGGDALRGSEAVDLLVDTNTVSFTRGGALNLKSPGTSATILPNNILEIYDLVEISGSAHGQDGLYIITAVTNATLSVYTLDFATPVFVADAGLTAKIYRPLVTLGKNYGHLHIISAADYISDIGALASSVAMIVDVPATFGGADTLAIFQRDPHAGTDYFKIRGDCGLETSGSIRATDTIIGNNYILVANDFGYRSGSTKTMTVRYGPNDFQCTAGAPVIRHTAQGDPTTPIVLSMTVGDLVVCELKLPQGAMFNRVSMLWNPNKAGSTVRFWQEAHTYGSAPVVVNPVNYGAGGMDLISVSGGLQDLNATYGGIATIDNDLYRYYITVQPDGASTGDLIYELKLTFDVSYLRAMGA